MAPTLSERLLYPDHRRQALIGDCAELVAAQARERGPTVRTAFAVVRRVRPDLIERALRRLLPEFAEALDPLYTEFRASGETRFDRYLLERDGEVADRLLAVTDRRVDQVRSHAVRGAYRRLRGRARAEVTRALPAVADVLARNTRHAGTTAPQ